MVVNAKRLVENAVLNEIGSDPVYSEFKQWFEENGHKLKKQIVSNADEPKLLGAEIANILRDMGANPSSRVQASAGIQHQFKIEGK